MMVRALAVQQPWAGLIANGAKTTEWRSWSTPYRGPILIVASRSRNREGTDEARLNGQLTSSDEAKGATLCVVDVVDVAWNDDEGLFAWKLARPRLVPVTPIKGKLNLYNETVPDSWARHFASTSRRASRAPATRALSPRAQAKEDLEKRKRRVAVKRAYKKEYEEALAAWRAAGSPDGPLVRAVVRAERRWKGPRP